MRHYISLGFKMTHHFLLGFQNGTLYAITWDMRCIIFILALISASCAPQRFSGNDPGDVLRPFVDSFYVAWGGQPREIQWNMIPLEGKSAECVWDDKGKRIININSTTWDDFCEFEQKALVWHEMGHCVLMRAHMEQAADSYMVPSTKSCEYYEENETALEIEMFEPNVARLKLNPGNAYPLVCH